MNARMAEATRLTRSGRLQEAMALLRGSMPMRAVDEPSTPAFDMKQDPAAKRAKIIDMVPPLGGKEGPWTAARAEEQPRGTETDLRPDSLRDLMERHGGSKLPGLASDLRSATLTPLPDGARFEEHVYANQAGTRSYKLYVPSSYGDKPLPLIICSTGAPSPPMISLPEHG
jgi:hypothetical protein